MATDLLLVVPFLAASAAVFTRFYYTFVSGAMHLSENAPAKVHRATFSQDQCGAVIPIAEFGALFSESSVANLLPPLYRNLLP